MTRIDDKTIGLCKECGHRHWISMGCVYDWCKCPDFVKRR